MQVTELNASYFKNGFALAIVATFLMMSLQQYNTRVTFDNGLPEAYNNMIIIYGFIFGSGMAYGLGCRWVDKEARKNKSQGAN